VNLPPEGDNDTLLGWLLQKTAKAPAWVLFLVLLGALVIVYSLKCL